MTLFRGTPYKQLWLFLLSVNLPKENLNKHCSSEPKPAIVLKLTITEVFVRIFCKQKEFYSAGQFKMAA